MNQRSADGDTLRLTVEGFETLTRDIDPVEPGVAVDADAVTALPRTRADAAEGRRRYEVIIDGWRFEVTVESAGRAALRDRATRAERGAARGVREHIRARIPGRVVRVWVAPGDVVEAGQRLMAVEAMKMENEIRASHGGTVESVAVAIGQTVELGDELVVVGASRDAAARERERPRSSGAASR